MNPGVPGLEAVLATLCAWCHISNLIQVCALLSHDFLLRGLTPFMRARSQLGPTHRGSLRLRMCSGEMPAGKGRASLQFGPHRKAAWVLSFSHCRRPLWSRRDTFV